MAQSPRLTDRTAERLLQMIHSDYRPGERLPGEAQLCQLFQVSRTTLREAVRSLAAQGFLEVRRGSGTFVLSPPATGIDLGRLEAVQARLRDLFEIRMMIEPQAARLACIRGSDQELEEICRRAQEVARAIRAGEDFSQAEENFHLAFVMAAHNRVMSQLLPIIHNALHETWAALDVMSLLGKLTLQDNEVLLDFLRQRDGEGAQYAMATHIRHTINVLNLPPQDGTILD